MRGSHRAADAWSSGSHRLDGHPVVGDFPEKDVVPSPGGWQAPDHKRPGWDWVPPGGARPIPHAMVWWIRLLYRTPFLDRRAHILMWKSGGFLVLPPDHPWLVAGAHAKPTG